VRIDVRRGRLAFQHRSRLGLKLLDRLLAGARHGLVGRDHQALDSDLALDRRQRDHHLHRRAVGVGDQAQVPGCGVGVHLGDYKRDVGMHAPVARVVDDDGARLDDLRRPLGRDRAAGRAENDVEPLNRLVRDLHHLDFA
jgi:hypothetical protein